MGTAKHVQDFQRMLKQEGGVAEWNRWRKQDRHTDPQLYRCDARGADLHGIDLSRAYLYGAVFDGADLRHAFLSGAHLRKASFEGADLRGARMFGAALHETNFSGAKLDGAHVHGISAWRVETDEKTTQRGLIITLDDETDISVDDLEVAQFMYLILNNEKIRNVINTITSSAVLILGRFGERKSNLDAIRAALRQHGYLPILFDFNIPANRDITETVRTLAGLARFIVADLTEPASIPKELEAIVPKLTVPIRPIIEGEERPYEMFKDYWKYFWVIKEPFRYRDEKHLINNLEKEVIDVAESMFERIELERWAAS